MLSVSTETVQERARLTDRRTDGMHSSCRLTHHHHALLSRCSLFAVYAIIIFFTSRSTKMDICGGDEFHHFHRKLSIIKYT